VTDSDIAESTLDDHPLAQRFFALTPDRVFAAVEVGGRRCTGSFAVLNSYENRVYLLQLDDGSEVVGKFYRPGRWGVDAISDEHAFLAELVNAGVPVADPLILDHGSTIGTIDGIFYALYDRVYGRAPQELDSEQLQVLGRQIARIHTVGARPTEVHRPPLSIDSLAEHNLQFLLDHEVVPAELWEAYEDAANELLDRVEPLLQRVPTHRIHGDCHAGNLIWSARGPVFLDFDDMLVGPAVQDIWMLVPSYDEGGQRQRELLLEAYREVRDFDEAWLLLIEPLRGLRYIHFATWIARRWSDPSFRLAFTYFGTQRYWRKEIDDLHEQVRRIDGQTSASMNPSS
jgi:Ser/Thr protein kinase RdoA (MazF antagonist)